MRGFSFPGTRSLAVLILLYGACFTLGAQGRDDSELEQLDSAAVSVSRAGKDTPFTYTMVDKKTLRAYNSVNSLPMNLSLQPSVVTYNEGGTGLGNSNMTIRGSKGSQINVTLNGITLNDSESQEVFWVNIPALTSLISSVQLQRGLGTSANGAGSFGASVNMSTGSVSSRPFGTVELTGGSYGTLMGTLAAGTGLRKRGFYLEAAFSRGSTEGYIRNAFVRSSSGFVALGWLTGRNSLRLTYLMGDQRSGITWDGISLEQYALDRTFNEAGMYNDDSGNVKYYDNQTDNYAQHHVQLNYTHRFSDPLTWTTTLNYTRGDGYDEYYKTSKKAKAYGFGQEFTPGVSRSDMIYRKMMGNDYYVLSSDLKYRGGSVDVTGGVNFSRYVGNHFGNMLWVKALGEDYDYGAFNNRDSWYSNRSDKYDFTGFLRTEWQATSMLTAFADLQYRRIVLGMNGRDDDYWDSGLGISYDNTWNFFNPRGGLTFRWSDASKAYASVAVGHREPGRSDIKENIKGDLSPIKPEGMVDIEAGYQYTGKDLSLGANLYLMEYWDMLLETGKLSSSGYAIKENVPRGWRRGVELYGAYAPASWLTLRGNATLSTNKIDNYVAYVEILDSDWNSTGRTRAFDYGRSTMLMSPSLIGMLQGEFTPWKNSSVRALQPLSLTVDGKYVGKQYLDNTGRESMAVPAYFVMNAVLSYSFKVWKGTAAVSVYLNNALNHLYYAAGWRWENVMEDTGETVGGVGVYPQAPRNGMVRLSWRF